MGRQVPARAGDRLVPLGEIADVRFGIKTGANEFFYVKLASQQPRGEDPRRVIAGNGTVHELPASILRPAIVRPGKILSPKVTEADSDVLLVVIPAQPRAKLPALVREYIAWGEARDLHKRPTCANRRYWYAIEPREPGWILTPMIRERRAVIGYNEGRMQVDHNLFEVLPKDCSNTVVIGACLASTFTALQAEVLGRANLGAGALKTEGMDIARFLIVNPALLSSEQRRRLESALHGILNRRILMIYDEVRLEHRIALDPAFVGALGIADESAERVAREVQEAAARFVWWRLSKSGNAREARQTYDEWLASGEPFDANAEEIDE